MNDLEILKWLKKAQLESKSEKQKKTLEAMERTFYNSTNFIIEESVEDFLSAFTKEDLINKPSGELYEEYLEYCTDLYDELVTQSLLTRSVGHLFNLRTKPVYIDKKTIRVFK